MDAKNLIERRKTARPDAAARFASAEQVRARRTVEMLRRARQVAGMTQKALGDATGWDQSFISRTERLDGHKPSDETVVRWIKACGFDLQSRVIDPAADDGDGVIAEMVA